jgi:hypothetical protein
MAQANYDGFGPGAGATRGAAVTRLLRLAGAAATVALMAGIVVWGYKLAVRDAQGVPVILAIDGPIRETPEDPGGRIASHSGLSVNRIAAEGAAGEMPDRIVLAEPPIDLEADDGPGIGAAAPTPEAEADQMARTLALAEQLARQVAAETAATDGTAAEAVAETPAADLPPGALRESLRPMPRPRRAEGNAAVADASPVTGTTTILAPPPPSLIEIAPESVPAGTRLAQIGAFDDAETARQAWARYADRHATLFDGKARVIQPATSVGRTFYRLRVQGFATEDDSRRFCAAVEAPDLRCIPVTTR